MSRRTVSILSTALAVCCAGEPASAATYSLDLPQLQAVELLGALDFTDIPDELQIDVDYDFGLAFRRIDRIRIELSATGEPGLLRFSNLPEGIMEERPFDPSPSAGFPSIGFNSFDADELAGTGISTAEFHFRDFSGLLDGAGELTIRLVDDQFFTIPWASIELLEPSSITIRQARLTVEGLAIPEPPTLALALLALAAGIVARQLRPW